MKKIEPGNSGRRNFLKKTAMGVSGAILAPTILRSCVGGTSANSRVQIGHIGIGARGRKELMHYFLPLEASRSVAICDVWQDRQDKGVKYVTDYYKKNSIIAPECKPYFDFEEILQRDDIDAVNINTPDHWHVLAAIKAARAGKHVMVAKPLGLSYPNFIELEKALVENNVRFHYATQSRSMKHVQLGIDMIREGKIGEIERVDVWALGKNPVESPVCNEVPVPEGFDYNRWTGPAPLNPFCPNRVTANSSFFQNDYSIGFLAGMGAHPLDVMVYALKDKVDGIYSCEGTGKFWPEGGIYNNIFSWDLNYKYQSGIELHFTSTDMALHGVFYHNQLRDGVGTTFYGSKGWISLSCMAARSDISGINKKLNSFPSNKKGWMSEENTMGQMFVDIINGKSNETCPLDEAIISDTISHMGNIAIRTNRKVTWDPQKGEVVDDAEANSLYVRKMREPFTV